MEIACDPPSQPRWLFLNPDPAGEPPRPGDPKRVGGVPLRGAGSNHLHFIQRVVGFLLSTAISKSQRPLSSSHFHPSRLKCLRVWRSHEFPPLTAAGPAWLSIVSQRRPFSLDSGAQGPTARARVKVVSHRCVFHNRLKEYLAGPKRQSYAQARPNVRGSWREIFVPNRLDPLFLA